MQTLSQKELDTLRVSNGERVRLSDYPTDDFTAAELDKDVTKEVTEVLEERLSEWQERLYAEGKQSLLIVLQARDAGGKDSTVGHVMDAFNPNGVKIANFKQPTSLELKHDFLWRVHAQAPAAGMIAVFNRSHYEDILVTRVHGLIDDGEAERRLGHIVNFEQLLNDVGTRVLKFYLHLSPEEQKERLQDRIDDPSKHWKFNAGDLDERAKWHEYTDAFEYALTASRDRAPWYVIPADRKWLRDYLISQIILNTLEDMNPQFPEADAIPEGIQIEDVPKR